MERTEYVLGFMFDRYYDNVVLIRKLKPAFHFGLYNGVGGHIEPEEPSADAMAREFKEETGEETVVTNWRRMGYLKSSSWVVDLYKYIDDKNHINNIIKMIERQTNANYYENFGITVPSIKFPTDEHLGIFETKKLPPNIVPNLKWLIPAIVENEFNEFHITKW